MLIQLNKKLDYKITRSYAAGKNNRWISN